MSQAATLLSLLFGGLILRGLYTPFLWTAGSVAIWVAAWRSRKLSRVTLTSWLPWLGWSALAVAASSQPLACLAAWSRWTTVIVFFALARAHWGEQERENWFWALMASGAAIALAAVYTGWRLFWREGLGDAMTGFLPPYYNYSAFALAAAASAGVSALGSTEGMKGRGRSVVAAAGILAVGVLVVARARAALCGLAFAAVVSLARQGQARRLILPALLALGVAAGMAWRGGGWGYLVKRDKAASFVRPQIWRSAVAIAKEEPWLGEGPGNFEAGFARHNFRASFGVADYQFSTAYAHSEPLQLAAETGVTGLLLWIGALAGCLSFGHGRRSWTREAAFCASLAMGAQLLVDNMLQVPALALLFFSALAVASGPEEGRRRFKTPQRALLAGGLALAALAWLPAEARRRLAAAAESESPLAAASLAVRLFPADAEARQRLARAWLMANPSRSDLADKELEAAEELSTTNALYPEMRAELAAAQEDWSRALELCGQAETLEPNFLAARLLRARALVRMGFVEEGRAEVAEVERRSALIASQAPNPAGYAARIVSVPAELLEAARRELAAR